MMDKHKVLYLYKTPSKFYIQPVEQANGNEALIIDRSTGDISLNTIFSVGLLPANATSSLIYGIIGIKKLRSRISYDLFDSYLIVITKATQIGAIDNGPIYKMDQAQVIPYNQDIFKSRDDPDDWISIRESMLDSVLKMPNFYFSYSYDLTNTLQRQKHIYIDDYGHRTPQHVGYDSNFLWNAHLIQPFVGIADRYRLPFILGFISINKLVLDKELSWVLISRRSVRRAGTRFNSRGIDNDGFVSNFVETEQIVEDHLTKTSFVQLRGSIPLFWSQKADYRYKPSIEIAPLYDHDIALKKHFDHLTTVYNNVSVVNLIDHQGHEGELEREFHQRISSLQKYHRIPYHYFDFHKECSKMRWHRLSILLERLQQEIDFYGFFAHQSDHVIRLQNGVIRSNCIDSLDRTNVVQSMIAQRVLELQLTQFGYIHSNHWLSSNSIFKDTFANAWADNADALSIQYAGTPALKTDFTRTGKRTQTGLLKDGVNSLTRYISNNFFDNYRQDAIDLFLGHIENYETPLYRPLALASRLPVLVVALTLVVLYIYLRY